ncbi:MAG: LiaF-related protein [Acidimicrobiia bacterium]
MRFFKRYAIGATILVGLLTVAGAVVRRAVPSFGTESDEAFSRVFVMAGGPFRSTAIGLRSGEVLAFMGGAELDLRRATIVDGAKLRLRAVMGGIDVIVPSGWRVETASSAFMGGIDNRTDPDAEPDGPLLLIESLAVMGGIAVHVDGDA